jgi:hypothetical protein
MPPSGDPVPVVFKKPGYQDAEQPLVARSSGPLNANLRPTPPPVAVGETREPAARDRPASARSGSHRSGSTARPRKPGSGKGASGQEDDVLMPDFMKK